MRSVALTWGPAFIAGLLVVACGGSGGRISGPSRVGDAEGDIDVSGSSTVAPISAIVADEFNYLGSPSQISIDDPGTGDGFAQLCAGEIEIADASRPVKPIEVEACVAAGVEFIELEVALDGITVLTNAANEAIECLTYPDLYALLGPEAAGVDRWQDAENLAARLGSTTALPDAALEITAPGTESGTYDAFVELVLGDIAEVRLADGAIDEHEAASLRADYSSQSDDNAIIAGIEGSESSLGFVGFAFAEGAGEGVREIAIDGGDGCVEPSIETIADRSYPISRSLYIYVNAADAMSNRAIVEYVDFYLSDTGLQQLVEEAAYVPLPPDRIERTRRRWAARTVGSTMVTA